MKKSRDWSTLEQSLAGRLMYEVPLAPMTTLGIGGPAAALARPDTPEELARLIAWRRENDCPCFILGGGSNVIFDDAGFDGLVIKLGPGFAEIRRLDETRILAGGAAASVQVMILASRLDLGGLECLVGIPGTIGGAVRMNAGAGEGSIGQHVASLYCLDGRGRPMTLGRDELAFEYRALVRPPAEAVILEAVFELRPEPRLDINDRAQAILKRRSASQPTGYRSAGCIFKNPAGLAAGKLIDECGFKGAQTGGARVSEVHANFIVNVGGAKARDFMELMGRISREVYDRRGLILEPEVKIIGRDGRVVKGPDYVH